jgi:hypothetical protein
MNQIETWFGILTSRRIRRGNFQSVDELVAAIKHYIEVNHQNPKPFVWTESAHQILGKTKNLKIIQLRDISLGV